MLSPACPFEQLALGLLEHPGVLRELALELAFAPARSSR